MLLVGWFSEPTKKGSEAFGSFPFGHLSGCVLSPAAVWIFLESGGLWVVFYIWMKFPGSRSWARSSWRTLPNYCTALSWCREGGKAPKLQHTEWFVPPNWGFSWAWQNSRLPEKPGRAGAAATGFSVQIVQYSLKKSHSRAGDNQLMILPSRLFFISDEISQDYGHCPKRRVWLLMGAAKDFAADGQRVFFPLWMTLGSLCSTAEKNVDVLGVLRSRIRAGKQEQRSGLWSCQSFCNANTVIKGDPAQLQGQFQLFHGIPGLGLGLG